jgi:hypothetical protein
MENIESYNFDKYRNVFCDSLQALEWAYNNGLSKSAVIKSSAPAMLLNNNKNIFNLENRWSVDELTKFQGTIQKLTKDIFDLMLSINNVERELALTIALFTYRFQKIIYKAACLCEDDFTDNTLFIYVDGKTGPAGNIMNYPWDEFLTSNALFSKVNYTLTNDEWKVNDIRETSYWKRLSVAGYETIAYRLATKLTNKLPGFIFNKEILMPNENELNIEIASFLSMRGVKITRIEPNKNFSNLKNKALNVDKKLIYNTIFPIMRERVERWVDPSAVNTTMSLFKSSLEKYIYQFNSLVNGWNETINNSSRVKKAVLVNSPGNIKCHALSYVCRKSGIPVMASQHGVTVEISKAHSMLHVALDNSIVDVMFSYNNKITDIEKSSYFDNAKHYVVGMPMRLIRMNSSYIFSKSKSPIVYISLNLYRRGLSVSSNTDYRNAKFERKLVNKVLSVLPHAVCYKTYPEDNRRYADIDPVLNDVKASGNIELFSEKIDMRYLLSKYRVLVTTCATSTLGWVVMSGKPVVFINQKNKSPLTDDAHKSLSKGLFLFDDNDKDFHNKLKMFLSQPIEEIDRLWKKKRSFRKCMIKDYFSTYRNGAGKRASKIIIKDFLT